MKLYRSGHNQKNMFLNDALLFKAAQDLPTNLLSEFEGIGAFASSRDAWELARLANSYTPTMRTHDDWGQSIEKVDTHPAYHSLLQYSYNIGLANSLWERRSGENGVRYQARAIRLFIMATLESGHLSAISTTSAGIAALIGESDLFKEWQPKLLGRKYDSSMRNFGQKDSVMLTFSFSQTFDNGVREPTLSANFNGFNERYARDTYSVTGEHFRINNPTADGIFIATEIQGEPSCLFVPHFSNINNERQYVIEQLLQQSGMTSRPLATIKFQADHAWLIGQKGQGRKIFNDIETMLRFDQAVISAGILRRILDYGITLFRAKGTQENSGVCERVFADMALDVAAAEALIMRLAYAFDSAAQDKREAAFARIMTPVISFWISNLITSVCAETIAQSGNDAFYKDSPLTRILNDSSSLIIERNDNNRQVRDVIRAAQRAPGLFLETITMIGEAVGNDATRTIDVLKAVTQVSVNDPSTGRLLVEQMAYTAASAALLNSEISPVINAFIESRLAGQWHSSYGTLSARHNARQIIDLLYPHV